MSKKITREFYIDKFNPKKVWEVAYLNGGGLYLRQYIAGRQWGKGIKTTKKFVKSIGIFDFDLLKVIE